MDEHSLNFLKQLLTTPGPSGDETRAGQVWCEEAKTFADEVWRDVRCSSYAFLRGDLPRVLLAGHIDEIGIMINYIDDDGYLYFSGIGSWDPEVLIGQRVRLLSRQGDVIGVIGKKAVHLLESEEQKHVSKIKDLWIDIGAKNRDEASQYVRVGDVGVIDSTLYELPNGRIVSRSIDNRVGAFVVLEALRRLAQNKSKASVAAVATSQEEISGAGARTSAFSFDPQVALVVDATFSTDHPESNKKQDGDVKLGGGPVLSRGSANSPILYEMLLKTAEHDYIPYSFQPTASYTGSDADVIHLSRGGVATAVIFIPCRYLHSPNEMVELADVENTVKLVVSFIRSLRPDMNFLPK